MSREFDDQIEAEGPAVSWVLCTVGPDGVWPESAHRTPEAARAEAEAQGAVDWDQLSYDLSEGWTQSSRDRRWMIRGLIDPAEWLGEGLSSAAAVEPMSADLLARAERLVGGMEVDLDAPLTPEPAQNIFVDLGFPPEEAERLLAESNDEIMRRRWERQEQDLGHEATWPAEAGPGAEDLSSAPGADESPSSRDPDVCGGLPVIAGTRVPLDTLRDYLAAGRPLDEWRRDYPSVSRETAVRVIRAAFDLLAASSPSPITRDPDICGGLLTFARTAVPVYMAIEHLIEGGTLDEWCANYPTVPPEQAVAALRLMLRLAEHATEDR